MLGRSAIVLALILGLSCFVAAQLPISSLPPAGMDPSNRPDGRNPQLSTLVGSVRTLDNHPVANARIEVRDISGSSGANGTTSTYTSASGDFEIDNLPNGSYEVSAYSGLFETHERLLVQSALSSIELRVGSNNDSKAGGRDTVSVAQFQVPEKAREAFRKAQQYTEALKFQEAGKYVAKALSIYPRYAEAMALRGVLKLDTNQPQAAAADLEQAVQLDSAYPVAYIALGAAYNVLSRFDDAVRTIDRGIALSPNSWQGYFEMGKAYAGKNDFAAAVKQLNKAEDMGPKNFALVHLVKAHALLGMKDYANAMTELEAYLSRDPKGPNSEQARQALERVRAFAALETR